MKSTERDWCLVGSTISAHKRAGLSLWGEGGKWGRGGRKEEGGRVGERGRGMEEEKERECPSERGAGMMEKRRTN